MTTLTSDSSIVSARHGRPSVSSPIAFPFRRLWDRLFSGGVWRVTDETALRRVRFVRRFGYRVTVRLIVAEPGRPVHLRFVAEDPHARVRHVINAPGVNESAQREAGEVLAEEVAMDLDG